MAWKDLSKGERFVFEWQKGMSGSFMSGLAELICKGDLGNQAQLAKAFPDEVEAIQKYQNEPGWWEAVKNKGESFE